MKKKYARKKRNIVMNEESRDHPVRNDLTTLAIQVC